MAKTKAPNPLKAFVSKKEALKIFKTVRDGISDTEWAAVTSGSRDGFESSIFAGKPDWKKLLDTPKPSLTEAEQSYMDNEVEEICAMINDWEVRDELHDLPPEVYQAMKDKGLFGLIIPEEFDGKGFSAQAHSAIVGKLNSRSGTLAVTAMVPNSLGPAELLMNYGTEEQKKTLLPKLATGELIPAFGLTSENAGSDATGMTDEGMVYKDDNGDLKIRMNFSKRYITLAPIADLIGLAYNLRAPKALLEELRDNPDASFKDDLVAMMGDDFKDLEGEALTEALTARIDAIPAHSDVDELGITLSLVPADSEGLKRGERHRPGGAAFHNGIVRGEDVEIGIDTIIGEANGAGEGWNMLVDCLAVGRSISLPATAAGSLKYLAHITGAYAGVRNQFGYADKHNPQSGSPLARMEGVQEYLTRIAGNTYLVDAARHMPLQELDHGHETHQKIRPAIASAILKYNATEAAAESAADSMAVHGGKGVVEGPNNPVAHLYQGAPVGQTVEGANSLTRTMITFGQSMFLSHPLTMEQMKAADNGDAKEAHRLFYKQVAHITGHALRSIFKRAVSFASGGLLGTTAGSSPVNGDHAKYYKQINRLSSNFAFVGNTVAAILQKGLKGKQRISGQLADAYSNLYMASQVLRKWENDGQRKDHKPLMEWCCQTKLYEAEQALITTLDNMGLMGKFLKAVSFPIGGGLKKPSHRLENKVASIITTPGAARDALTDGIYLPASEEEYLNRLDRAFEHAYKAGPYEATLAFGLKKGFLTPTADKVALVQEAIDKGIFAASYKKGQLPVSPDEINVEEVAKLLTHTAELRRDITAVDAFAHDWVGAPVNPTGYPKVPSSKSTTPPQKAPAL